ncbi:MAG: YceI family protein [Chlorobi bacterium]|nr:YceI family protein [Chlorobiota bacterium]
MKLKYFLLTIFIGLMWGSYAQKYITKSGRIDIVSNSPLFTVEGVNKKVASILNTETGELVISMLIRSFEFEEALMEEQFNGNYMQSKTYPKSIFKGRISNIKEIDFAKDGKYKAQIEGKITIHGITKEIREQGLISISEKMISAESEFYISLSDFDIKIEKAFKNSIDDKVLLKVNFKFNKQ